MKYGIRRFGDATCLVSACMGVPERMRKDIREISRLQCLPEGRGQGLAADLMKIICNEADTYKMVLLLTVEPFGEDPAMSAEQLLGWYCTAFGFNVIQSEPLILARQFILPPKAANE